MERVGGGPTVVRLAVSRVVVTWNAVPCLSQVSGKAGRSSVAYDWGVHKGYRHCRSVRRGSGVDDNIRTEVWHGVV